MGVRTGPLLRHNFDSAKTIKEHDILIAIFSQEKNLMDSGLLGFSVEGLKI